MDLDLTPSKSADETEIDTPPRTHAPSIKNHAPPPPAYKECMKNHAASIGGQAVDGCGEYMPPPTAVQKDPTSLTCAACGCHRNFHRREPADSPSAAITPPFLDFRPPGTNRTSSATPPPRPSFQYSPRVLLGLGGGAAEDPATPAAENPAGRKRLRTKFSQEQKEKMHSFAEKIGWRMQKSDEAAVAEFCRGAGVARGVLKVWMHNNKSTFGGRKESVINGGPNLETTSSEKVLNGGNDDSERDDDGDDNGGRFHKESSGGLHFHHSNTNGSSSSA